MPQILHEEYLDVNKGIESEIVNTTRFDENSDLSTNTTRFDENSDLSTTYLGRSDKPRNDKLRMEESFPISEHGYMSGRLLDGTECKLLLDTGASKSFMSKFFYM